MQQETSSAPAHPPARPPGDGRSRRLGLVFAGFAALIAAAVVAQTWWAIEQDRRIVLESEQAASLVTVRLLEEHAAQTLVDAERNLDTVISELRQTGRRRATDDGVVKELIGRAQPFNRALKSVQFVNAKGEAFVGGNGYPAFQTDADDRDYVAYLLAHPRRREVMLGTPFQRFYDAERVLPIAKNIYDDKGRYLGVLSTDISLAYFNDVHARAVAGSKAVVALLTRAGRVVVRSPALEGYPGRDVSAAAGFLQLLAAQGEGAFSDSRFLATEQPAERAYTYRRVSGYPLTALYARERGEILAAWVDRSRDRAAYAALFVLVLALLAALLRASFNRLSASEASLRRSEASLRVSESKFSSLFQQSPVPLALINLDDDRIIEANGSFLQQFELVRDSVLGATPLDLRIWEDSGARLPYHERLLREGKIDELEARLRTRSGGIRICLVSARVIEADQHLMALFSPIDVTRQRGVEREIRELNVELENRVLRRTATLEETNKELAAALGSLRETQKELLRTEKMAALGSLVAGVAHELNTPIGNGLMLASTLQGNAEDALAELAGERPRRSVTLRLLEDGREISTLLVRTLQRAAELVSSFKQVAVDQSSDKRRRFELNQTLQGVLATLKPMHQSTPFTLRTELGETVDMESYPGALAQIITNLLSNALAHGFDGRSAGAMRLSARPCAGGEVEIRFCDDGNGIAADSLQRVFDPFYTTKLGQGGSGLGMHIVYNLVTGLLGGSIALRSEAGAGTELVLRLPRVAPLPPSDAAQQADAA
ncbi:ATP-binding protein [Janthinobacterium sp.]|uniref:ATP-binding protein n=1 Tax=Janthinobacterium sp. TaxID=1871054 RepID=UPI00293D6102|nr:ATP-binding protein [Janthinobacterium sp.]